MSRQLKRWESPRREGRNDKGRGGSARQRQRRKQFQALRQKLKDRAGGAEGRLSQSKTNQKQPGEAKKLPFFVGFHLLCSFFQAGSIKFRAAISI